MAKPIKICFIVSGLFISAVILTALPVYAQSVSIRSDDVCTSGPHKGEHASYGGALYESQCGSPCNANEIASFRFLTCTPEILNPPDRFVYDGGPGSQWNYNGGDALHYTVRSKGGIICRKGTLYRLLASSMGKPTVYPGCLSGKAKDPQTVFKVEQVVGSHDVRVTATTTLSDDVLPPDYPDTFDKFASSGKYGFGFTIKSTGTGQDQQADLTAHNLHISISSDRTAITFVGDFTVPFNPSSNTIAVRIIGYPFYFYGQNTSTFQYPLQEETPTAEITSIDQDDQTGRVTITAKAHALENIPDDFESFSMIVDDPRLMNQSQQQPVAQSPAQRFFSFIRNLWHAAVVKAADDPQMPDIPPLPPAPILPTETTKEVKGQDMTLTFVYDALDDSISKYQAELELYGSLFVKAQQSQPLTAAKDFVYDWATTTDVSKIALWVWDTALDAVPLPPPEAYKRRLLPGETLLLADGEYLDIEGEDLLGTGATEKKNSVQWKIESDLLNVKEIGGGAVVITPVAKKITENATVLLTAYRGDKQVSIHIKLQRHCLPQEMEAHYQIYNTKTKQWEEPDDVVAGDIILRNARLSIAKKAGAECVLETGREQVPASLRAEIQDIISQVNGDQRADHMPSVWIPYIDVSLSVHIPFEKEPMPDSPLFRLYDDGGQYYPIFGDDKVDGVFSRSLVATKEQLASQVLQTLILHRDRESSIQDAINTGHDIASVFATFIDQSFFAPIVAPYIRQYNLAQHVKLFHPSIILNVLDHDGHPFAKTKFDWNTDHTERSFQPDIPNEQLTNPDVMFQSLPLDVFHTIERFLDIMATPVGQSESDASFHENGSVVGQSVNMAQQKAHPTITQPAPIVVPAVTPVTVNTQQGIKGTAALLNGLHKAIGSNNMPTIVSAPLVVNTDGKEAPLMIYHYADGSRSIIVNRSYSKPQQVDAIIAGEEQNNWGMK